ncbi:hypothetical protein HDV05_004757, partial [Chytridiales sp. JEL 0842]
MNWEAIEQREREKLARDKALKDFLLVQQAESRDRKRNERRGLDVEDSRRVGANAGIGTNAMAGAAMTRSNFNPQTFNQTPYPPAPAIAPAAYGARQTPPGPPSNTLNYPPRTSFSPPPQPLEQFQQQQRSSYPSIDSTLPTTFSSNPLTQATEDLMTKLKFTESQLESERRSRSWLEAEIHAGKTLLASLQAKVEKLSDNFSQDALVVRDLARHNDMIEKRVAEATQELSNKLEKSNLKIQSLVSDMQARQRATENAKQDESERTRMLAEELSVLRYKVESFSLHSVDIGNELRSKARDWEVEAQKGSEALRAVQSHDHALETLHQTIEGTSSSISKKLEMSIVDIRTRLDQEARARFQFENNMKELYSEVRKILGNQDRESNDRIESTKIQIGLALDRERAEREKSVNNLMELMRSLERGVKESVQAAMDKVGSQVLAIDDVVSQERQLRSKFEAQVRTEVEEGFKMIQIVAGKKIDEMQMQQAEARQAVGNAIKTLKEAVVLVEKSGEGKLAAVEEVLRAEIRSRMETERALTDLRGEIDARTEAFERRAMDAIAEVTERTISTSTKIEEDVRRTAEQLILAKTRTIEDIETQVSQIRKRMKEDEAENLSKFRQVQLAAEQVGREAQTNLENAEARFETRLQVTTGKVEDLVGKLRDVETSIENSKAEMEDKLNFRVVQIDSTMNAFKEELDLRVSKQDAQNIEKRFEASVAGVQSSVGHLQVSIQGIKDDMDKFSSKKEMDDMEQLIKSQISHLNTRFAETDGSIITVREDMATKSSRKDFEKLETDLKSAILGLQLKDVSIDETIQKLQEELGE